MTLRCVLGGRAGVVCRGQPHLRRGHQPALEARHILPETHCLVLAMSLVVFINRIRWIPLSRQLALPGGPARFLIITVFTAQVAKELRKRGIVCTSSRRLSTHDTLSLSY